MFVHSTSWGSLAIMLVMDHSITRKIRFPAFSSLPTLQVVRKYLIFGLVGANLFARSGVIMEALLWVSMIVYERWDFWGQFSQRKSTRTILLQDTPLVKGCGKPKCRPFLAPCRASYLPWNDSWLHTWRISRLHYIHLIYVLLINTKKIVLLWENICFWLPAFVFWRLCIQLKGVLFAGDNGNTSLLQAQAPLGRLEVCLEDSPI